MLYIKAQEHVKAYMYMYDIKLSIISRLHTCLQHGKPFNYTQ